MHLYYGAESGDKLDERIAEIAAVARYFGARADRELNDDRALILLGDFNIVHPEHKTMKALLDNGFQVPRALALPTNIDGTKCYDQIAFKTKPEVIEFVESERNAGVFPLFDVLMRDNQEDFDAYQRERCGNLERPGGKERWTIRAATTSTGAPTGSFRPQPAVVPDRRELERELPRTVAGRVRGLNGLCGSDLWSRFLTRQSRPKVAPTGIPKTNQLTQFRLAPSAIHCRTSSI